MDAVVAGVIMMETHTVQPGECLSLIAFNSGFFVETLWNHECNADLRAERDNPNVLASGDQVNIPDKRIEEKRLNTDARHRFRLLGVPDKLRLCLKSGGRPRSQTRYRLTVDDHAVEGITGTDGVLEHWLMPDARRGELYIYDSKERLELQLRRIEPVTETAGLQARLKNLDFYHGKVDGMFGKETKEAIKSFQAANQLDVTGRPDQQTQDKLKEVHGC